jgi:hypothetical protein
LVDLFERISLVLLFMDVEQGMSFSENNDCLNDLRLGSKRYGPDAPRPFSENIVFESMYVMRSTL